MKYVNISDEQLEEHHKLNECKYCNCEFSEKNIKLFIIKKVVYSYEYIDNYKKLYETQLPSQEAFYSSLNNSSCND